jgi:sugar/nucleoside kinase (ribokinase family)
VSKSLRGNMKYDVVTIGDASEDIFIRPDGLKESSGRSAGRVVSFELGTKISVPEAEFDIGGSACNTAVGFSRLGLESSTIIALGEDSASSKISERLIDEGVGVSNIVRKGELLANFSVIFLVGDERTIFIHRYLKDYGLLSPKKSVKTEWIYLGPHGEDGGKLSKSILYLTAEKNVKLAWNPGSNQIEQGAQRFKALLANTKILFLNKEEAINFINLPVSSKTEELLKTFSGYGVGLAVITDGKHGADCFDGEKYYHIDALNQKRVDATGAGDSFSCGFTARIIGAGAETISSDAIREALFWGILNSSSVVNVIGAQKGLLAKSGIEEAISSNPRLSVEIK